MKKVTSILSLVTRILVAVVLFMTAVFSLLSAYIIFAPDTFPKPFYLEYRYPLAVDPAAQVVVVPTPTPEPKPGEGLMLDTGAKIINLADSSGRKLIRVNVVLEFAPPHELTAHSEGEAEGGGGHGGGEAAAADPQEAFINLMAAKKPLIDDVIVTLISTKTFDQLYTAAGKEELRTEIMHLVNERFHGEYRVISVYFTEFVVE